MKNLVVKYFLVGLLLIALCTVLFVGCDSSKKGGETDNNKVEETTACEHTIDWKTTKEPTCAAEGLRQYVCSKCGLVKNEESIPKTTEHTMVNGTCSVCGISNEGSQGLEYERTGDHYYVSGIGTCTDSKLVIGSTYNGLPVEGIHGGAFENCDQITEVIIGDGSEMNFGNAIFKDCKNLKKAVINVNNINTSYDGDFGTSAFSGCSALEEVIINPGISVIHDDAFSDCYSLKTVSIPDGVKTIGQRAFSYCKALTEITLPDSVTAIEHGAFNWCSSLQTIDLSDNLTSIGMQAFEFCEELVNIELPQTLQKIGSGAFENTPRLNAITIPDGVTVLEIRAFYHSGIKEITLPDTMTEIQAKALICGRLTSLELPEQLVSIDSSAINQCSSLKEIYFPAGFTGDMPGMPYSLSTITVNPQNPKYMSYQGIVYDKSDSANIKIAYVPLGISGEIAVMDGVKTIEDSCFTNRSLLEAVILPDSVTELGEEAFWRCTALKRVVLKNVAQIKQSTFYECSALESISLGTKVTEIGSLAFANCVKLQSVTIPASVLKIDYGAFRGCTSLENITLSNAERLSIIGEKAFADCSSLKDIYLPASADDVGKSAFEGCTSLEYLSMSRIGYNTKAGFIGYFFGASSYHDNSKYVPASLKHVSVSSETVPMNCAFYGCKNIETVVFGPLVKYIGQSCFQGCTALTSVKIMNYNGISIYGSAFEGCTNLNKIEVAFSTSKWSSITKQDGWDTNTGNYQVYCTDGTLSK